MRILMYVQSIYMMRLRCYELYVQPRAELISSSDMIIEMHSMALLMRFRLALKCIARHIFEIH